VAEIKPRKRIAGEKISTASKGLIQNKNLAGLESGQTPQNFRRKRTHIRDAV
jgi:hypothetical protein